MRLARIAVGLTALLLMMSVAARAWGQGEMPNPALAGFSADCDGAASPCWYGIVPGETTSRQAEAILKRVAEQVTVVERDDGGEIRAVFAHTNCRASLDFDLTPADTVYQVLLSRCDDLQLGDTITALGVPVMFDACAFISNRPTLFYDDGFKASLGRRLSRSTLRSAALSPFLELRFVSLSPMQYPAANQLRWKGFQRLWRYCQWRNT